MAGSLFKMITVTLILILSLCACGGPLQPSSGSETSASIKNDSEAVAPDNSGSGTVSNDNSGGASSANHGDPGDYTGDINWWGMYNSGGYLLGITNYNGDSFRFTFYDYGMDDSDLVEMFGGVAAIWPGEPYNAEYMNIHFGIDAESETVYVTVDGDEWSHFSGTYTREDRSVTESSGGGSDPGDYTGELNWLGTYRNEDAGEFLEITDYNGGSFQFMIHDLSQTSIEGLAEIRLDEPNNADYMYLTFSIYADSSAIHVDGSDYGHLDGTYTRYSLDNAANEQSQVELQDIYNNLRDALIGSSHTEEIQRTV